MVTDMEINEESGEMEVHKEGMACFQNNIQGINVTVNVGQLTQGFLLKNRIVMVTGATQGIGCAIAEKCICQGAKVIITGRNKNRLAEIANGLGENCVALDFDMREVFKFDAVLDRASKYFGPIDSLVNNAGISLHEGDFINVTEETWDDQFSTNLKGPYFLTQSWLRHYRENHMKSGRIIMMASDTSGMGSSIPYGLAKAGIASLTHGLAKKLITEGVRINAVAPGTTLTPMTEDFTHGEVCRESTIGKRALFPEEIAELVVFLLSDLSTCISGNIFGCSEANICFNNVAREQETNP